MGVSGREAAGKEDEGMEGVGGREAAGKEDEGMEESGGREAAGKEDERRGGWEPAPWEEKAEK